MYVCCITIIFFSLIHILLQIFNIRLHQSFKNYYLIFKIYNIFYLLIFNFIAVEYTISIDLTKKIWNLIFL